MKRIIPYLFVSVALVTAAQAEDITVKLTEIHMCCDECVNQANKAVAKVEGVKSVPDKETDEITLTGPDLASVQKAVDSLVTGGFFGKSSNPGIKLTADTGAKGEKVQTLKVEGVHLCCGECASAVGRAMKKTPGATGHTAKKNATSFEVTGDFNDKEFFDALHDKGLNGHVVK